MKKCVRNLSSLGLGASDMGDKQQSGLGDISRLNTLDVSTGTQLEFGKMGKKSKILNAKNRTDHFKMFDMVKMRGKIQNIYWQEIELII